VSSIKLIVSRVFKVNQIYILINTRVFFSAYLTNLGYSVNSEPIPVRNLCEVHVYDLKVFTCDIRNLQFGGDGELDDLCREALRKITDVTSPSSTP